MGCTSPDVIRELPNRLQSLSGKTVVLDGTLITTRFHFANIPHEFRHVLGWYRLLNEFRLNNVKAICVFDGKGRVAAKKAENARRRDIRDANLARGNAEQVRAKRLREFERLLPYLNDRVLTERPSLLPKLAETPTPPQPSGLRSKQARKGYDRAAAPFESTDPTATEVAELPLLPDGAVLSDVVVPDDASVERLNEALAELAIDSPILPSPPTPELAERLESLLDSYAGGLQSKQIPPAVADVDLSGTNQESQNVDGDVSVSLTRSQLSIASSEGQIWASLTSSLATSDLDEGHGQALVDLQSQLTELALQSEALSQSYRRTADLPRADTFREVKTIIEAMGVPWTDTNGDIEAEALAASIVRSGKADYVASEDTDVLVYQAPLLRNVTSHADPLVLVDSALVPAQLSLSVPSFIDFAILIGTDFTQRLRGLGPNRALKLLQTHDSIENVLDAVKGRFGAAEGEDPLVWREQYLEQVNAARRIFSGVPRVETDAAGMWRTVDDSDVVVELEMHNENGEYDARLVAELLEGFELSWLASRSPMPSPVGDAEIGSGTALTSLDEDYFDDKASNQYLDAGSNDDFASGSDHFLTAHSAFADNPRT